MDIPIMRAFPGSVYARSPKRQAAQGAAEGFEKRLDAAAQEGKTDRNEAASPQGWTKENLAALQERYSGKMSINELHEALIAMTDMGIISDSEAKHALGCALLSMHRNNIRIDSDSLFTMDDIFAWVAVVRKAGRDDYLPYSEPVSWRSSGFSVSV